MNSRNSFLYIIGNFQVLKAVFWVIGDGWWCHAIVKSTVARVTLTRDINRQHHPCASKKRARQVVLVGCR